MAEFNVPCEVELLTLEEEHFVAFFATETVLSPKQLSDIFNSYFNFCHISPSEMRNLMLKFAFLFEPHQLELIRREGYPWLDPEEFFGLDPCLVWKATSVEELSFDFGKVSLG
ncbi:MAG: hypothetical protein M1833_000311 [Piccolia ochrophora]|nr:MAG: hypothetical protein M1833_000311 [Piccolia ochrophora]